MKVTLLWIPLPYALFPSYVSRHAGLKLALSTLDGVHDARGLLLVGGDGRDVLALDRRERGVCVVRVGLVPVEAGEVFLKPLVSEDLAVARVDFLPELARVFEEHAFEKSLRYRLHAQRVFQLALEADDGVNVLLLGIRKLRLLVVFARVVPRLAVEVL